MNELRGQIGFGGAALSGEAGGYGFGPIEKPESLVKYAIERGIKYFDTAPIYGFGESERVLGQAIKQKRDSICIVNKCGVTWHDNKRVNLTNEPGVVVKMLESSLKRMELEYFDIYMVHWPDKNMDIRYTLEALLNTKDKIKHIGLCNTNPSEIEKANEICEINYFQSEYNLFNNGFNDLKFDTDNKFLMGWGTFDKGILSGKISPNRKHERSDARSWAPWWKKSNWRDKVRFCEEISDKFNVDLKKYALYHSLKNVDLSLVGTKNCDQLDDILSFKQVEIENYNKIYDEFKTFS